MKQGIIYKYINKVNDKCYIGQTINPRDRKAQHLWSTKNKKDDVVFHRAIRKYGIEQFEYSIIWSGDKGMLNEMEEYFIKEYDSFKDGYNMTKGGDNSGGNIDKQLYKFYHPNYGIKEMIRIDFEEEFNINPRSVYKMIKGRIYKGWIIVYTLKDIDDYYKRFPQQQPYIFEHPEYGLEKLTRIEMKNKYNFGPGFKDLFRKSSIRKQTSYKGWKIIKKI